MKGLFSQSNNAGESTVSLLDTWSFEAKEGYQQFPASRYGLLTSMRPP